MPAGATTQDLFKGNVDVEQAAGADRWERMWAAGLQPGQAFDATAPSPAIVSLISSGEVDVRGKRVFVPGCGRGYDVALFHRHGAAQAVGLELAPTAVQAARQYLAGELAEAGGAAAGEAAGAGADEGSEAVVLPPGVAMEQGNFFEWTSPQGDGSFDVGYDYTFGCAMDPPSRGQWAAHWSRHLAPGALLVTLVFPIMPDADPTVGPPFPISPQLYRELLEPHGFEVVYQQVVPHELSHGPRAGKEEMMIWRKK